MRALDGVLHTAGEVVFPTHPRIHGCRTHSGPGAKLESRRLPCGALTQLSSRASAVRSLHLKFTSHRPGAENHAKRTTTRGDSDSFASAQLRVAFAHLLSQSAPSTDDSSAAPKNSCFILRAAICSTRDCAKMATLAPNHRPRHVAFVNEMYHRQRRCITRCLC